MGTGGVRHDERTDSQLVAAVVGRAPGPAVGGPAGGRSPDPEAFGILFDRWHDRCWNVARNIMRSDDLAAEVTQDAMLVGWQRLDQLQNPDAFGGWLLRITRNRALTRLEREGRSRATGDDIVSAMRDRNIAEYHDEPLGAQAPPTVETVLEAHDQQELVWAASAALGERDASLLDLHLRHGLTPAEIAEELGVEANAAHQQLFRLRNKLGDAIGSYLLWRNGRTLCRGLAAAVSGDVAFDRSVARAVAKHQKSCDECSERRAGLISPTKLFASVPLLVVPLQFKVDAAAALAEAGVPIDPSAVGASGPPPGPSSGPPSGTSTGPGTGSGQSPTGGGDGSTSILQPDPIPGPATHPAHETPAYTGHAAPTDGGVTRNVGWTTARSAWLKSLLGAVGVILGGLILIALLPGVALSDLWPFGGETDSIGSETLAGPAIEETSTTRASDNDGTTGLDGSTDEVDNPASTSSSSTSPSPTTATTATTTPTTSTTAATTETTETTETTASSTSSTVSSSTTATTTDTSQTTSTDQDTTSSSSTTETTEPPAPPRIVRFISRPVGQTQTCIERNQEAFEAVWATENADSVELFLPDGSSVVGKPSDRIALCGQSGDKISLVAFGPGGTDKASTTLG